MSEEETIDLRKYRVPVWCPVCDGPMKGKSSVTFYQYGSCQTCFIEFIEGREQKWLDGWRPSAEQMKLYQDKYFSTIYSGSSPF